MSNPLNIVSFEECSFVNNVVGDGVIHIYKNSLAVRNLEETNLLQKTKRNLVAYNEVSFKTCTF